MSIDVPGYFSTSQFTKGSAPEVAGIKVSGYFFTTQFTKG